MIRLTGRTGVSGNPCNKGQKNLGGDLLVRRRSQVPLEVALHDQRRERGLVPFRVGDQHATPAGPTAQEDWMGAVVVTIDRGFEFTVGPSFVGGGIPFLFSGRGLIE